MLQELPLIVEYAAGLQPARALLPQTDYQAILTEAALSDGNWLDVLHLARHCPHETQVVVTCEHADAALWAETLNLGVYDVLAQPFYAPEVRRILTNACTPRRQEAWIAAV